MVRDISKGATIVLWNAIIVVSKVAVVDGVSCIMAIKAIVFIVCIFAGFSLSMKSTGAVNANTTVTTLYQITSIPSVYDPCVGIYPVEVVGMNSVANVIVVIIIMIPIGIPTSYFLILLIISTAYQKNYWQQCG